MFEPLLPENLEAFRRFRRLQMWSVVAAPVAAGILEIPTILLANLLQASDRTFTVVTASVAFTVLGAGAAWMGYMEIRKTKVFLKDLRERVPGRSTN